MNSSNFPVVKVLIPYIFGILWGYFAPLPSQWVVFTVIMSAIFLILSLFLYTKRSLFRKRAATIALQVAFLMAGYYTTFSLFYRQMTPNTVAVLNKKTICKGKLSTPLIEQEKNFKCFITIIASKCEDSIVPINEAVLCYFQKDSAIATLRPGDELLLHTTLQRVKPPQNPKQFHYQKYLQRKNIYLQAYIDSNSYEILGSSKTFSLRQTAAQVQQMLAQKFVQAGLSGAEFDIIAAILLGYSKTLDPELKASYANAGVSHILCVSGMHVGIIFMILNVLLHPLTLTPKGRYAQILLLFIILWSYALITGLSPSVTRAAAMFSFVLLGKLLQRRTSTFHSLFASLFILLIINPLYLFEVGFQLSYMAVFGIVIFQRMFESYYVPKNKVGKYLYGLVTVSISAQLATLPITLFYFGQFPNYFLLANLSVITLSFTVVVSGILVLFTSFSAVLSQAVAKLLFYQIKGMNFMITTIENFPNSVIQNISLSVIQVVVLYLLLILIIYYKNRWKCFLMRVLPSIIILFQFTHALEQFQQKHAREWCLFSIPKTLTLASISNNNCVIYSDSIHSIDDKRYQYSIYNYVEPYNADIMIKQWDSIPYFSMQQKTFFILRNHQQYHATAHPLEVDYLIVDYFWPPPPNELHKVIHFRNVILNNNVAYAPLLEWKEYLTEANIPYHSIKESGAFVEKLAGN